MSFEVFFRSFRSINPTSCSLYSIVMGSLIQFETQTKCSGVLDCTKRFFVISRDKSTKEDVLHIYDYEKNNFTKLIEMCRRPHLTMAVELSPDLLLIGGYNYIELIHANGDVCSNFTINGFANILHVVQVSDGNTKILCSTSNACLYLIGVDEGGVVN